MCGRVQVMHNQHIAAAGAGAKEEAVEGHVSGRLCCDASGNEVWMEAGVCT